MSTADPRPSPHQLVIEAGRTERQYWRDLWRYRELFYFLAWRDLLVRYKQTAVGIAWSLLRPVLTMVVLTIVFGRLGKMPSGGVPYPLLVFCGMLPWQFFSSAIFESGNSLVNNSNLISKVYFPRLVVPTSSVITSFGCLHRGVDDRLLVFAAIDDLAHAAISPDRICGFAGRWPLDCGTDGEIPGF